MSKFIPLFFLIGIIVICASVAQVHVEVAATNNVCFCHNVNNNPHTICTSDQGQINGHTNHVNNGTDTFGECPVPTNTPTPTVHKCWEDCPPTLTPTNTPTLTPTLTSTPSATPTTHQCDEDCDITSTPSPTVTVVPTEGESTPSATIAPTNQPGDGPGLSGPEEYKPPECTAALPDKPLINLFERIDSDTIRIGWLESDTNLTGFSLNYGHTKDNLPYGIPDLPKDSRILDINGLDSGSWWFLVNAKNGPSCSISSEKLDP